MSDLSAIIDTNFVSVTNYQTFTPSPFMLICNERAGAGTSSYWAMLGTQRYQIFQYFETGPRQKRFISWFWRRSSLWCSTDSCGHISFITFWPFALFSAYLWIERRLFRALLGLDNYRYQTHERNITKFYLRIPKHTILKLNNSRSVFRI